MRYELRFALRYIFSKRSFNFITVISIISFIGITIGVSAIIIVLSIFNGFREFTENQLIGFDPHIRISNKKSENFDLSKIKIKLKEINEIQYIAEISENRVVGTTKDKVYVFNLISLDKNDFQHFFNLKNYLIYGSYLFPKFNDLNTIIIGAGIADKLKLVPGDTLNLTTPKNIETSIKMFAIPKSYRFAIGGIFQTNIKDFDYTTAFIDKNSINYRVFSSKNTYRYLDIKLKNIEKMEYVSSKIKNLLGNNFIVMTWKDLHKDLFKIMNFERYLAFTILSMIIIIAVFNVLSSLTMTVIEKKRDIGILTALGAKANQIRNIFLYQGILIGVFATIFGVILGILFCLGQIHFQWFKLSNSQFLISAIPIKLQTIDILLASAVSLILTFLSSIYPAKKAAKSISIENIREE